MKVVSFSIILLFSLGLCAQEKTENFYSSSLSPGEMLWFGKKSIEFKEVVTDSRCPKEVTCIWEGEAKVRVHIYEDGKFLEEKILDIKAATTPLTFSHAAVNYQLMGLNLLPYPTAKTTSSKVEYTLQLKVKESFVSP